MTLFVDVFRNSILITGLVMVMMLLIEYIHIYSQGRSLTHLQNHPMRQIALSALLGLIPGCVGGFAAVSLFTHGMISFGALIAMMVSTIGDEAFVLFATAPKTGIVLVLLLFPLALIIGRLTDLWVKRSASPTDTLTHYALHHEEGCQHGSHAAIWGHWRENFRRIHPKRAVLLIGLLAFIIAMSLGLLEHEEHEIEIFSERWINLLFTFLSLFTLALTVMASNHFISEHLWFHIIQKHLLKIFLWTFGALLCIAIGLQTLQLDQWVQQNGYIVLLLAALIGLIPESGPHLIFIALYASGAAPFSVLFVSSFVQDGHTALPLLAERKGAFVKAKLIKLIIGVAIGSLLYFLGV